MFLKVWLPWLVSEQHLAKAGVEKDVEQGVGKINIQE